MTKTMNTIEILNELLVLVTTYFMLIFTNFVNDVQARYYFGFALNSYILIIVTVNIAYIVVALV